MGGRLQNELHTEEKGYPLGQLIGGRQQLIKDVSTLLTQRQPRRLSWVDRLRAPLIDGSNAAAGSALGLDPEGFRSHALSTFAPSQSDGPKKKPLRILSS